MTKDFSMRYIWTLTLAAVLTLHSNARAADHSKEFEIANKTTETISVEMRVQGAKPAKKQLKKSELWKTTFDHSKLPTVHITTSEGDELNYEFEVAASQSIKLVFEKNWKTKEPELKPKFASDNIKADGIRKAEAETPPHEEPADGQPPEVPVEEPVKTPKEKPVKENPSKPAKKEPVEDTSTLKVKVEQLFDVEASMSEVEKAQKILNVKFLSDVRVAMGEQEPKNPEDLKRAEAAVTAAYKAQANIWKAGAKLSYKIVAAMKKHDVTDPKDQKALAAKGLELINSTYEAIEKKFAK